MKRARTDAPAYAPLLDPQQRHRLLLGVSAEALAVLYALKTPLLSRDGCTPARHAVANVAMATIRKIAALPHLGAPVENTFSDYTRAVDGPHESQCENRFWGAAAAFVAAVKPRGWRLFLAQAVRAQCDAISELVDAHQYGVAAAGEPAFVAAAAAAAGQKHEAARDSDCSAWRAMRDLLMQAHNLCAETRWTSPRPRTTFFTLWVESLPLALAAIAPGAQDIALYTAPAVYLTCDAVAREPMPPVEILMYLLTQTSPDLARGERVAAVHAYLLRLARDCPALDADKARCTNALRQFQTVGPRAVSAATWHYMVLALQLWCAAIGSVEMVTRVIYAATIIAARFPSAYGNAFVLLMTEKLEDSNIRAACRLAERACRVVAHSPRAACDAAQWEALAFVFHYVDVVLRERGEDRVVMPPPLSGVMRDVERAVVVCENAQL